jgi:hypothetical protein
MNFGGPVWHASVAAHGQIPYSASVLFQFGEAALAGVGDATLGEWREVGDVAVHLRRRLSDAEARIVGPVVDVRRTAEGRRREQRMRSFVPVTMAASENT